MDLDAARRAIAACARELWDRRLVTGTSGNLSMRLDDGSFAVTPTGAALRALDPAAVVHVDASGRPIDGGRPSIELPLHLAAYGARSDARVVVHTHPTFCVVWAGLGRIFPRETVASRESLAAIGWVPYHPPGSRELAEGTASALADAPLALLESHGLVAIGTSFDVPFVQTDLAEECARVAYFTGRAVKPRPSGRG